jgi:hypothetical protein
VWHGRCSNRAIRLNLLGNRRKPLVAEVSHDVGA